MPEEDTRSDASFQSAADEDLDLPRGSGEDEDDDDALPPGLEDEGEEAADRWNLRKDGNREQLEPIHQRLLEDREHIKVSKMFSYVLRHSAHKMDVGIRKDGYVRLRDIMKLRNFKPYNLEELMAVVYFDEKERFTMVREFDGELLIRANQGHTMKVVESDMLLELVVDPETVTECVHGTYLVHWPFIKKQGLSKVARNHIHLANGMPEDGKIRGMRATAELFVYVDVPKAMEEGVIFYRSKNDVILTQGINGWLPPKYFHKAVRIDYNTCDIEEMEFEPEAEVPAWAAELAPSGPGEQGTYLIKNLEALIGNCKKRLSEINDLKAMQENGEELSEDELSKVGNHAEVYTELQSLEQRWRQHKGHRKENAHEKEQRAMEEAESGTIVRRKDRAVAPPWEKQGALESGDKKATEKEKAEWAMIGKRRENAPEKEKAPKKDDPWDKIGSMRSGNTPAASSGKPSLFDPADRDTGSWRTGGGESSRRSNAEEKRDGPPRFFNSKTGTGTPVAAEEKRDGPPRFINSKTGAGTPGGSWRDRMTTKTPSADDRPPLFGGEAGRAGDGDRPSWRKQNSAKEESGGGTPSWRSGTPSAQADETPSWRSRMTAKQQDASETSSWRK